MDELPELAFEQILSYLCLKDVIKSRAVSRAWKLKTDNYRVKSLCYSNRPSGFIWRKSRWVSGAFAQNFISSTRCNPFFKTFGRSILSNLKHLRLCDLVLKEENPTTFIEILQSFSQLEELDIIQFDFQVYSSGMDLELSLPMLRSIHIEYFHGVNRLTLDAPRLLQVRLDDHPRWLDLVQVESVERVIITFKKMELKQLKNLKQLYVGLPMSSSIDPTLLSGLEQLREVHLHNGVHIPAIFEQKQRYGRADLKIYLHGLLLSGPEDPTITGSSNKELFVHLVENPSRLADEIPFQTTLHYSTIEQVALEVAINIVKRMIDLEMVFVDELVQDIERFLVFLNNLDKITRLQFSCNQPQELFDRLPEHCTVQWLSIDRLPPDPQFLVRLKYLSHFFTSSIKVECIRRILEELEFVTLLEFDYSNKRIIIEVRLNLLSLSMNGKRRSFLDVNALIQFLVNNA